MKIYLMQKMHVTTCQGSTCVTDILWSCIIRVIRWVRQLIYVIKHNLYIGLRFLNSKVGNLVTRIVLSRDASAWDFWQIWHLASHDGNLPILGDRPRWSPLLFYNIWQYAKYNWHSAKSTLPAPQRSQLTPYLTSVTKIGPGKAHFCG